ncbi:MAG: glycerate kinase, partial [Actinomycetota bacterium]
FSGKVVGGVAALAREHHKPVLAICGDIASGAEDQAAKLGITAVSLQHMYGDDAMSFTTRCAREAAEQLLSRWSSS